jgi:Domain of unknown function (DUF4395)
MLSFSGNRVGQTDILGGVTGRHADPYRDLDVIDSRAPRTNQAVIGAGALLAFLTGAEWLVALLALQLLVGLTLGRRWCLPCLAYFELVQPRIGEGPIEDSRPPRFANMVGVAFLGAATVAFVAGLDTAGWALTLIVAALALLAAVTGFCAGCRMYVLLARLRLHRHPGEALGGNGRGVLAFSSRFCLACRHWEEALGAAGVPFTKVDVSERPDLVRRYGVTATPLVLAVDLPGGDVVRAFQGEPDGRRVGELRSLATT